MSIVTPEELRRHADEEECGCTGSGKLLYQAAEEIERHGGNWYLLFEGTSADGRGEGEYIGRTVSSLKAKKHFLKCKDDPYSTGKVEIVTDDRVNLAMSEGDFK